MIGTLQSYRAGEPGVLVQWVVSLLNERGF
nr:MAG TPA_asm: hypothetical protein [Caudoviricetes sp.]